MDREFASVGLSRKAGWHTAAWMYSVGATLFVIVSVLNPGRHQTLSFALAVWVYGFAAYSFVGSRLFENSDRAIHIRLVLGIGTMLAGALLLGPGRTAFALFTTFMILTPALLYGPRFTLPYAAYAITFVFVVELISGDAFAKAWITASAVWMVTIGLMVARWRARELATANTILANTDALTGAANTRRLHQRTAELLSQTGAEPEPFTLFALDLDNFKQVNDLFDHATGDRLLIAVADELERLVDGRGLVARRGGDEFSLVVTGLDVPSAELLREQIATAIRRARLATCPDVSPSGSVAFVQSTANDTIASLMRRADDALHAEKAAFHEVHGPSRSTGTTTRPQLVEVSLRNQRDLRQAGRQRDGKTHAASVRSTDPSADNPSPAWMLTAAILAPVGLVLASMALPGLLNPLSPLRGGLLSAGLIALSGSCVIAHRLNLRSRWLHMPFVLATALLFVAVADAGPNGAAIVDLLAVIGIYAFFYFRPGVAALYLAGCFVIYASFAVGASYPQGVTRSAVCGLSMLMITAAVLKVRSVTFGFAMRHRELSEIDALTGVANIRSMKHRLNVAIAKLPPNAAGPTLIALDLDDFKSVNDRHSHTVGDQMIAAVANAIGETMHSEDFVGRRGGDEFLVLVEQLDAAELPAVVDRLREAVVYSRKRICPELEASVSIATATWRPGQSTDDFMRGADAALHDAKVLGRIRDRARFSA